VLSEVGTTVTFASAETRPGGWGHLYMYMYNDSKKGSLLYFFLFYGANLTHALVLSDPPQVETGQGTGTQYVNLSTLTSRMGLASEDSMEEGVDKVRTYIVH
jgi:hypothetical protein